MIASNSIACPRYFPSGLDLVSALLFSNYVPTSVNGTIELLLYRTVEVEDYLGWRREKAERERKRTANPVQALVSQPLDRYRTFLHRVSNDSKDGKTLSKWTIVL